MNKLIVYFATICTIIGVCSGLRGTPIFPKYKGVKVENDYHYKEMWYPQTVSNNSYCFFLEFFVLVYCLFLCCFI